MDRRRLLLSVAALAASSSVQLRAAAAEGYPAKPVRMIVPWPAGGIVDLQGRKLADRLSRVLGKPVVIDNRPGASGTIGLDLAARARPDGYTLVLGSSSNLAVAPALDNALPYDALADFAPVSLGWRAPMVLLVNPALGVRDAKALIALAKAKPGELTYGSNGPAGTTHIAAEYLRHLTGIDIVHVPYKGAAPAMLAAVSGEVQLTFDFPVTCIPQIKAGKLQPLLVTSAKRIPALPDVPTAAQAGVPGLEMEGWAGVLAPAGVPPEIVSRLHAEIAKTLASAEARAELEREGSEAAGTSPEQFRAFIQAEQVKWARIVKLAGVRIER